MVFACTGVRQTAIFDVWPGDDPSGVQNVILQGFMNLITMEMKDPPASCGTDGSSAVEEATSEVIIDFHI